MILRGNWYRLIGKNKDLYNKRNAFCESCPFNSKHVKDKTDAQWAWSLLGDYCTDCTCPLKSKLVEPLSECPQLKWGQEI
jgi:hypothetical protein